MLAAVVVLLGSAASAAAVVLLAVLLAPALLVPVVPVPVPHEPQLPALAAQVPVQLPPALRVLLLAQAPPGPLLHRLSLRLPRVAVESEVPAHLQGRRSFAAAMARSSPPTGERTRAQAPQGPPLRRSSLRLPRVAAESEVPAHLQGRRSFSAAMARSSPPTGKPTFDRAPSTR